MHPVKHHRAFFFFTVGHELTLPDFFGLGILVKYYEFIKAHCLTGVTVSDAIREN